MLKFLFLLLKLPKKHAFQESSKMFKRKLEIKKKFRMLLHNKQFNEVCYSSSALLNKKFFNTFFFTIVKFLNFSKKKSN